MKPSSTLLPPILTLSTLTTAQNFSIPATQNASSSTACADLHILVARASGEKPGQGIIGTLATMITAANPGSSVEAVDYAAVLTPYGPSSANGTAAAKRQLASYLDGCDKAWVVLLGYSQGAQVVGDAMCGGGGGALGPFTDALDEKYARKVVAMIQMGDPRHLANKSFDVGTSVNNGLFPRPANISCDKFASMIQSYCNAGDPFCDQGNNLSVHLEYAEEFNNAAFGFVMNKIKNATSSTSSSSSNSSNSTNSTGSGSKKSSAARQVPLRDGSGFAVMTSVVTLASLATVFMLLN